MAKITGVGGVFFKSKGDNAALAAWYRKHLGMSLELGGAILKWPYDKAEDQGLTVWHVAEKDSEWFSRGCRPGRCKPPWRADSLDFCPLFSRGDQTEQTPRSWGERLLRCGVSLCNLIPIYRAPERCDVVWLPILVLEIIRMFPHVQAEDRDALGFGDVHERVVLIRSRSDNEFALLADKPCPTGAKARDAGVRKLFL